MIASIMGERYGPRKTRYQPLRSQAADGIWTSSQPKGQTPAARPKAVTVTGGATRSNAGAAVRSWLGSLEGCGGR
jgi:hypothetical protein